jgi:competence protein ComEA
MGAGLRGGPGGLAGRRLGVVVLVVAMAAGAVIIGMARSSQPPSRVGAALDEQLPRAGTAPAAAQKGGDAGTDTGAADRVTPSVSSPAAGTDKPGDVPVVLWVHAAGAVKAPGLYRVADGARVADLLNAAGGPADDADTDRINLAAPLADAMRVYVPHKGEQAPPAVVGTSGPGGDGASGGGEGAAATGGGSAGSATPSSPVDLNTATAAQLDTLPGVGPATAASIIAWRTEHGRFASVDDLLQVRGIGPSRMEQLRPLVSVS